ncbi:probable LRR receptor-like serine/threonine-protein kinase At2g16250 [Cornus florida]|uniref:probable LRR receptor-like serine/threonine-protein kinase At2g16250 n=1 Tax=Cornus florida TaxID=4283 RepID=UPI0028975878|nr:probable LRR receptor-like serine/threonine-protein kinase At2g16250 [Cornus florida]XP_059637025.1 probable LRR receptor-like serine/threonine-protein kinase At2g16250 [Cornus florida]
MRIKFCIHTISSMVNMEAQEIQLKIAFIFLLINSVLTQQQVRLSSDSEWSALLELRSSLGLRAKDWPKKTDPCIEWNGVKCQNGRVVGLTISGLSRTRRGRLNPRFAVDSLPKFTLLESFNSSGFSLPGSIPDSFGQSLGALRVLDLRSCSITGLIPSSLGNLSRLNLLYLSHNELSGTIPSTLGMLSSLSVLNLSQNLLSGSIPSSFSTLRNLTILDLSSNYLSGPIPTGFGSISGLQFLNLSYNSLTASIPVQLGKLSRLVELDIGFNSLSGSLPEELGGLRSLQKMLVGNNGLEGPLPANLFSNLTQLRYVVLGRNNFDGDLTNVLWSNPQLGFLDVSSNNFTGVLPDLATIFNASTSFNFSNNLFYGNLSFRYGDFRLVDLSSNYLQGQAPNYTVTNVIIIGNCLQVVSNQSNQRSSDDCQKFYSDRGLTFYDDRILDPTGDPLPERSSKRPLTYVMVGLFGGLGLIILLILVLVVLLKTCKKRNANQRSTGTVPEGGSSPPPKVSASFSGLGQSFTYEQMLRATGGFSDTNLIKHGHSGDFFQGTFESGFPIVIKRIDLHSIKKESYMLELDIFSKVSHPRLVPLLGHCLENENEKLLVYKHMPNRDLSNSFYRSTNLEDGSLQSLDWITRLKIAIGAAEGLSYLHHECNPPLVHRDIQASSILLDDNYEVRLGSLSEVCAEGGETNQNVITWLLRMPLTSDQGPSGSTTATCAYDVYCFGKVLLSLVTGKLAISKSDNAVMNAWLEHNLLFISIHEKELLSKIVDQSLLVNEDLLEEVWAMAVVAKSCLNPKPSRRPKMRHVLRALENPLKVVREENYSSARLRTTSSRKSWSAAFFGSWRHSSSDSGNGPGQTNREGISGVKHTGRVSSHGSGANDHSSSRKRSSSEIFPEPADMQDLEKQDEN